MLFLSVFLRALELTWHLRSAGRSLRCSNPHARYLMMFLRFRTTYLCYSAIVIVVVVVLVVALSLSMPCIQRDALEKSGHSNLAILTLFSFWLLSPTDDCPLQKGSESYVAIFVVIQFVLCYDCCCCCRCFIWCICLFLNGKQMLALYLKQLLSLID